MRRAHLPLVLTTTLCLLVVALAASSGLGPVPEDDCTSLVLDNGGQAIFATNYDRAIDDDGLVFIHNRGVRKRGFGPSTTGVFAEWTAEHASVVFSLLGYQHAWAGMNERGLSFSTMALSSSESEPLDHRPPLDWMWMQYLLDTCETVQDVIDADQLVHTYSIDHYLFADRFGGVAVVEFLDGQMVTHSGDQLCVAALTNSTYSHACAMWQQLRWGGDYTGHGTSIERFCRAADRVTQFSPASTSEAVDYAFTTLRVAYPPDFQHYTRWSIVFDTVNLRAYFRTQRNPHRRWVDLLAFDLGCVRPTMMLDINTEFEGDLNNAFIPFDPASNRDFMQGYFDRWFTPYDPQYLDIVLYHVESFYCPRWRRVGGRRLAP